MTVWRDGKQEFRGTLKGSPTPTSSPRQALHRTSSTVRPPQPGLNSFHNLKSLASAGVAECYFYTLFWAWFQHICRVVMKIPFGNFGKITDDNIKAHAAVRFDRKPVCGTSHVSKAKMAAVPIPIEQSCSYVSEPMLSYRDYLWGIL